MERTRLRELTPFITPRPSTFSLSRNGAYPIKGIDTKSHHTTQFGVFQGRNGAYPIKGIDTRRELVFRTSYLVEMERTRLRELTHVKSKASL